MITLVRTSRLTAEKNEPENRVIGAQARVKMPVHKIMPGQGEGNDASYAKE